jgi:AcrR family transcriptional regulator
MSTESTTRTRAYRKRRRAALEEETRRRITDAAVKLHGTVGPARTTVSAIAEEAGVQRATVYRHFPDAESLFAACSGRWLAQNPLPDVERWGETRDPESRLRSALGELYSWYGRTSYMLERTSRDAPLVPAMAAPVAARRAYLDRARAALLKGRAERGRSRSRVAAAIGHALAFETWRSLVDEQGLDDGEAAELMARAVAEAGLLGRRS